MPLSFNHIIVTGGAGFIGSHFVRLLLRRTPNVRVTNVDKLTYAGNLANLIEVAGDARYRFVRADIAGQVVHDIIKRDPPDAIINFAAETHVDRSIANAHSFVSTDVLGTQNLLEAARAINVQRFIQVSTDEVYGSLEDGAATEETPLAPASPYAASKAGGDLLCLAFHKTYGLPVSITRGANTYGPNQYPEKLIPLAITNLLCNHQIPVYGDGRQRRDWLHVEDHCSAILAVLEHGGPGQIYNVGGGQERENIEIIGMLLRELSADEHALLHITDRPGHDRRYALECGKLAALGWKPEVPLEEGMAGVVKWYGEHPEWWRPIRFGSVFRAYYEKQYPMLPPVLEEAAYR